MRGQREGLSRCEVGCVSGKRVESEKEREEERARDLGPSFMGPPARPFLERVPGARRRAGRGGGSPCTPAGADLQRACVECRLAAKKAGEEAVGMSQIRSGTIRLALRGMLATS